MVLGKKPTVQAAGTGDARATNGGVANSGVIGELHVHAPEPAEITPEEAQAAVEAYAGRVRTSYGRLDLEVLTPLSEQNEHPAVELREVFVAPWVRADPPQVELPRELMKRLVEQGELPESGDLPPGTDPARLQRIHEAYRQRPPVDVLEVVADPHVRRVVLLGDPGAGKSTLARYLALTLTGAEPQGPLAALKGWLPQVIELRLYAEERWRERTFEDFLEHLHATEGMSVPAGVLKERLRCGKALVVFDGLDELFDPRVRAETARRIAAFTDRYPDTRVVVTSRVIGYQRATLDGADFKHHMLQDLTEQQIAEFARLWYATACPNDRTQAAQLVRRVTDAVSHSRPVRELAGNPLLLTILAIIGRRQTLPRDRQGVYRHAVTVLVAHLDQDVKHLKGQPGSEAWEVLDPEELHELLRLLARSMQNGSSGIAGNHIHGWELETVLRDYLRNYELPPMQAKAAARAMVERLRTRNFILSRYGGEVYGFVHRAFLEYLAAADIAHRYKEDREWSRDQLIDEIFKARAADPSWHEVLLLVIGQLSDRDAGPAIDCLLQLHRESPTGDKSMLALAIRALAEVRKIGPLAKQSHAVVDALIQAVSVLPSYRADSALGAALPALTTFSEYWSGRRPYLRWFHASGQFQQSRNWPMRVAGALYRSPTTLMLLARFAPESFVRVQALNLLGQHWSAEPETRVLICERATTDPHGSPRSTALRLLGEYWSEDPGIVALIRDRATADPEAYPRATALRLLGEYWSEDPGIVALIRDRATTDSDEDPRATALEVLAQHWSAEPETRALICERAATDSHGGPRSTALRLLGEYWSEDPGIVALIRDRATTDAEAYPRSTALMLLSERWSEDPGIGALIRERAIADPHEMPRHRSLGLLARHWSEDPGIGALIRERAVKDPDETPRYIALGLLADHWSEDPGIGALIRERAVKDPDQTPRYTALELLGERWSEDPGIGALIRERAVADPGEDPRSTALELLGEHWSEDPGIGALIRERAVADPGEDPRASALVLLAEHSPDQPDTRALIHDRAAEDQNPQLRLEALRLWAAEATDEARDALHDGARHDESEAVRRGAVWMLAWGWPADPLTLPTLREVAVHDPSEDVRSATAQAVQAVEAILAGGEFF
ncbi:HEAT repeat domain-containing protein [Streptomyces sp. NP-1717]|uniref:HEAT repeat domain-containing protein n=1 Tax=Streptomyces sp. NP-1717 TaxID=2704470 RepID=UPI001F5D1A65|nr:HEAT repeat domain-containing protein [Streptomyces sp. NP-1717]MCI3224731.1 NACHT domain-containing protein [Streptomyces sp. NP-1717]